jgi:hypothetical protein
MVLYKRKKPRIPLAGIIHGETKKFRRSSYLRNFHFQHHPANRVASFGGRTRENNTEARGQRHGAHPTPTRFISSPGQSHNEDSFGNLSVTSRGERSFSRQTWSFPGNGCVVGSHRAKTSWSKVISGSGNNSRRPKATVSSFRKGSQRGLGTPSVQSQ